jgi:late competence protein required for DNA uptake (superfamily II DNA/RNA helicase)
MADTELETSVKTKNSPQIEEEEQQQQKQEIVTDIEHEIDCPRCYDTMTLRSDFDSLYYFCEECAFILYTVRKGS